MEMRHGFVFSLDTALAITIAVIIISGISFNLLKGQSDVFGNLYLSKLANDALITLDKNGTLETLDYTRINATLTSILPNNLAFKLNITVYECADQNCGSFNVVNGENILINPNAKESDSIIAKRVVLTFDNSKIKYFSTAELRVWLI